MRIYKLINILTFLLIISCDNAYKKNYIDKNIICYDTLIGKTQLKKCYYYYNSGEKAASFYINSDSIITNESKTFYSNGKLRDSCYYIHGLKHDILISNYFNGKRKEVIQYIILFNKEKNYLYNYKNRYILYDSLTNQVIKNKSYYYSFEWDSIKQDSIQGKIRLDLPYYSDSAYLVIGDFDEFFNLKNVNSKRIISLVNNEATIKLKCYNNCNNIFFRGILYNINKNNPKEVRIFYIYEKK